MTKRMWPALLALVTAGAGAGAQETVDRGEKVRPAGVPLEIELVVSRHQGEKKLSSTPYVLSVTSNDEKPAELRTGLMVPVITQVEKSQSIAFKDVGTTLHCSVEALAGGLFRLNLGVEQNTVHDAQKAGAWAVGGNALSSAPVIRLFKTTTRMLLRDGQRGHFITGTDPVSGEVVKGDVTLRVVK
jgi:hypothetical protein